MRLSPAVLLLALALSAPVACGGDEPRDDAAPTSTASTSAAPDSCEPVAESPDGEYVVADAGEVTLRMVGSGLTVDVRSTDGWSTSVNSDNAGADIQFNRGDEEIVFEADIEAGRLVLQVCDHTD